MTDVRPPTSDLRPPTSDLRPPTSDLRPPTSGLRPPTSQRGVALIITVILLSVLTLTTLAFLSMSRRERGAVTTTTDTASARLAADAALANAEAQILANALATTNPYNFGLIVSTNYLPPATGNPLSDLTNLYVSPRPPVYLSNTVTRAMENRFYLDLNRNGVDDPNGYLPMIGPGGGYLHPNGTEDNIPANVVTNFQVGDPEWIGVLQRPDQPYGPNNPFVARFTFIALPIGNTLDLNAIHNQVLDEPSIPSPNPISVNPSAVFGPGKDAFLRNQGVGSWEINLAAFLGDLNTNQWLLHPPPDNLYYAYNQANPPPPGPSANSGCAFDDARALLAYRYNNDYNSLATADQLFPNAANVFPYDNIDAYSDRPLQTTLANINEGILANQDDPTKPWSGADNTNHFFTHQDLFDPNKTSGGPLPAQVGFTNRLLNAGNGISTYDRYTFYRLLSQLGTDSAPEQNKMNLNYRNMTNGVVVPNLEANFYPWTAIEFFTIAADRMLRDYSQEWLAENPQAFTNTFGTIITNNFGITNIPVWVDGRFVYTPAIQRVLQLAANIYDATTNNNTAALGTNFPSVFRPTFWVTNENGYTDVYIDGYEQVVSVTGTNDLQLALPVDITDLLLGASIVNYPNGVNVYGVPWIIGAKKGFPNFNEFSMLTLVGIDRKLEITRPSFDASLSLYSTNQMYILSISNSLGVECWNSYATNYFPSPGGLTIVARDNLSMTLSNMDNGTTPAFWSAAPNPANFPLNNAVTIPAGPPGWPGTVPWTITSARPNPNSGSFDIPLMANATFLTNSIYVYPPADSFTPADSDAVNDYVDLGTPALPQFDLVITNRLQVFMLDGNHVIDYVQFVGPDSSTNLNAIIADVPAPPHDSSDAGLWNTNLDNGTPPTPQGVINQILYSTDPRNNGDRLVSKDNGTWRNPPGGGTVADAIAALNAFLDVLDHTGSGGKDLTGDTAPPTLNTNLSVQVPFTPVRYVYGYTSWQANDPLVHYLASDLNFTGVESTGSGSVGLQTGWHPWDNAWRTNAPGTNLRRLNDRYSPWGWSYLGNTNACYNLAYKDPLVRSSDNWDFPTNKFPTVGWLGRVHRGTPWQTVYLKSPPVDSATWTNWTGDFISSGFDATNSMPTRDRLLFDLFTTAFNDNATRGQLSVNVGANDPNNPQAGLAAWSALFSGVEVFSNNVPTSLRFQGTPQYQNPPPSYTNLIINPAGPAGTNSALGQIVAGINQMRASFVNVDGLQGAFEHAGDILATPTLTAHSPFLNWPDAVQRQNGISDEMYEWLPQQAMSLLRVSGAPQSPMRYVIYSYGQALKPAPNSIYTGGGQFFGMVTNYQVVSETATRAVVRFGSTLTNNICFTNSPPTMTNQVINNNAVIESFNVMPPD